MGQILSQSEVESILTGLDLGVQHSEASADSTAIDAATPVSLYDFEHPEPLRQAELDALRLASAAASQSLQTGLSQVLHAAITVKFIGVEQSTYHEYLATAENPSCIAVFESSDSELPWLLDIHRTLAFAMIDRMLGGLTGESSQITVMPRPYTDVEVCLIDRAIRSVWPGLAASFTRQAALEMRQLTSDVSLIRQSTSNDPVVLISFEILCGANTGLLQMCVPWRNVAESSKTAPNGDFRTALRNGATKIPVTATVCVARLKVAAHDIAHLNPGDVLLTESSVSDEMTLEIDGCELFRGHPGQCHRRKVIRLTSSSMTRLSGDGGPFEATSPPA